MYEGNQMCTFLALTPVDEERIRIYGVALRNFLQDLDVIDGVHYEHNVKVLEQDRPIVEGLRPKVVPLEVGREVHVRSDAPQVRYRMMYRKMAGRSERDEG
jgi:phenylpropionate dioxygenase-like ring-hydroxylating dioxygenase large terminal subunit